MVLECLVGGGRGTGVVVSAARFGTLLAGEWGTILRKRGVDPQY